MNLQAGGSILSFGQQSSKATFMKHHFKPAFDNQAIEQETNLIRTFHRIKEDILPLILEGERDLSSDHYANEDGSKSSL